MAESPPAIPGIFEVEKGSHEIGYPALLANQ